MILGQPTANPKPSNSAAESGTTAKLNVINQILCGDSGKILETIPDHAIDLIFTSPPYAQQRQQQYASVSRMITFSAGERKSHGKQDTA